MSTVYKSHNYLGEFASDSNANTFISDAGWDDGGNPQNGMKYYNTTDDVLKVYRYDSAAGTSSWETVVSGYPVYATSDGTAVLPVYSFSNDRNTGIYRGTDGIGIATGGVSRLEASASAIAAKCSVRGVSGSDAVPSYSFSDDTNTGLYRSTDAGGFDLLGIATDGSNRVSVSYSVLATSNIASLQLLAGGDSYLKTQWTENVHGQVEFDDGPGSGPYTSTLESVSADGDQVEVKLNAETSSTAEATSTSLVQLRAYGGDAENLIELIALSGNIKLYTTGTDISYFKSVWTETAQSRLQQYVDFGTYATSLESVSTAGEDVKVYLNAETTSGAGLVQITAQGGSGEENAILLDSQDGDIKLEASGGDQSYFEAQWTANVRGRVEFDDDTGSSGYYVSTLETVGANNEDVFTIVNAETTNTVGTPSALVLIDAYGGSSNDIRIGATGSGNTSTSDIYIGSAGSGSGTRDIKIGEFAETGNIKAYSVDSYIDASTSINIGTDATYTGNVNIGTDGSRTVTIGNYVTSTEVALHSDSGIDIISQDEILFKYQSTFTVEEANTSSFILEGDTSGNLRLQKDIRFPRTSAELQTLLTSSEHLTIILLPDATYDLTGTPITIPANYVKNVQGNYSGLNGSIINFNRDDSNCRLVVAGYLICKNVGFTTVHSSNIPTWPIDVEGSAIFESCRFSLKSNSSLTWSAIIHGDANIRVKDCSFDVFDGTSSSEAVIYLTSNANQSVIEHCDVTEQRCPVFAYIDGADEVMIKENKVIAANEDTYSYAGAKIYIADNTKKARIVDNYFQNDDGNTVGFIETTDEYSDWDNSGWHVIKGNYFQALRSGITDWASGGVDLVNIGHGSVAISENHFHCDYIGYDGDYSISAIIALQRGAISAMVNNNTLSCDNSRCGVWVCGTSGTGYQPFRVTITNNIFSDFDCDGGDSGSEKAYGVLVLHVDDANYSSARKGMISANIFELGSKGVPIEGGGTIGKPYYWVVTNNLGVPSGIRSGSFKESVFVGNNDADVTANSSITTGDASNEYGKSGTSYSSGANG